MTKEEFTEKYKISIYAHRWWNFDEQPPEKYKQQVKQYLIDHPEEFKGADPQ